MMGDYKFPQFKAAAIQASPVLRNSPPWFNLPATLEKAVSLISEAAGKGARLVVFPECWLPCYPYWSLDLRDRSGFDELWANFLWASVEVPSRETEILGEAAKRANAYVVMGINERDKVLPGRMYNSILYLSPEGEIIGMHRKISNTVQERLFHTPGDGGDNLKAVYDTEIGKIGGSICGEHAQYPLLYNWVMQGIQIHCSLWPGRAGLENYVDIVSRSLCRIGHVFGVLSATYMSEKDMPKNFYGNSLFSVPGSINGGSGIAGPGGEYIAGPVYGEETIVYGDVNLADIDRTRFSNNLTGNYSRWDLFSLNVQQDTYQSLVPVRVSEKVLPASYSNRTRDLEARMDRLEQKIDALLSETPKETEDNK